jgi:hypothetical protein
MGVVSKHVSPVLRPAQAAPDVVEASEEDFFDGATSDNNSGSDWEASRKCHVLYNAQKVYILTRPKVKKTTREKNQSSFHRWLRHVDNFQKCQIQLPAQCTARCLIRGVFFFLFFFGNVLRFSMFVIRSSAFCIPRICSRFPK